MKVILYLIAAALVFFSAQTLRCEDIIKVLILENPSDPFPVKNAKNMGHLKGEIFFNDNNYQGSVEVREDENGLHFIYEIPFEKYVEGVINAETGEDWAYEALKAQAVISRTYALYQKNLNSAKAFHITSSVLHQAYKGENRSEIISQAVSETEGEILTYGGKPIEAFYHSTCTGKTELPYAVWGKSYEYLKSVPCRGEYSPYERWQRRFSLDEIEKALGLDGIKDLSIASFTSTGRADLIRVVSEDSETEIKALDLRKNLGYRELPSTHFSLTMDGKDVIFEGGGYGHGVGLSQWGSLEMAHKGNDYREILEYYYHGTVLEKQ